MAAICSDDKRWEGVSRVYTKQDVDKLRGSVKIEHTLARLGAERLWKLLHSEPYINALGALTGNQAVQQVQGERARHCTAINCWCFVCAIDHAYLSLAC
jgi:isocitrate lyase